MDYVKSFIFLMVLIGLFLNLSFTCNKRFYWEEEGYGENVKWHEKVATNRPRIPIALDRVTDAAFNILKYTLDTKQFCSSSASSGIIDIESQNTISICNYLKKTGDDLVISNIVVQSIGKLKISFSTSLASKKFINMLWSVMLVKFNEFDRSRIKNGNRCARNFYNEIEILGKYLPIAIYSFLGKQEHAIFVPFFSIFLEKSIEKTFQSFITIYYEYIDEESTTYGSVYRVQSPDTIVIPISLDTDNIFTYDMYYELHGFFSETYLNSHSDVKVPRLFCTRQTRNEKLKYKLDSILLEKEDDFIHLRKQSIFCGQTTACSRMAYSDIKDFHITLLTFKRM